MIFFSFVHPLIVPELTRRKYLAQIDLLRE